MPNGELIPVEMWAVPRALRGETVTNVEYTLHRKDTGETWVGSFSSDPIRDKVGKIVGAVMVGRDITERKRADEAKEKLELQNQQLQKVESLGRMAGAIAHHFNNQLQVVMMNLQIALQTLPQNAEPVENLIEAMLSARKAAEVSTLMLTYLGQTAAKYEPLDLCETCQRHLPMLRTVMPQSVTLKTELASPGPVVNANANQIQQILTNLLTNAWEAMSETRGVVRLTVKTVSTEDIPRTHRFPIDCKLQEKAYACAEVADVGCGIEDKDIEKVFDPFFSTKFTGRGLGLSVVLGIVRAHGGCVTVESQMGQASIFRVFLPLSSEAIPKKPVHVAQVPKAGGGTVLVVDDEPCLLKAVTLVLKRSGFTVFSAQDGVEAVEVFQQHRDEIGCVLCDLTMPRMDGWETLTALRKLVPDIPVILSSGYSEVQVMAGEHPELPQAFLSKPYEWTALKDVIVRLMREPKAAR
jgi:two-component system, cell cycle sensor histidine kinase and response regulator CckA